LELIKINAYICTVKTYQWHEAAATLNKTAAYFMPDANKHSGNRVGKWKHPQRQTS
jgi:hypothetical protein